MPRTAVLGLSSGILLIVSTLVGIALFNLPRHADAAVVAGTLAPCPLAETQLDQGYGVTRTALRPVCAAGSAAAPSTAAR